MKKKNHLMIYTITALTNVIKSNLVLVGSRQNRIRKTDFMNSITRLNIYTCTDRMIENSIEKKKE